jgi:parallel beta-helix repeat protein
MKVKVILSIAAFGFLLITANINPAYDSNSNFSHHYESSNNAVENDFFGGNCPNPGTSITQDTILSGDYCQYALGITEYILAINANNIILDCNNTTLISNSNGKGIFTSSSNITIKNCNIRDFGVGIELYGSEDSKIENNTILNNGYGISLMEHSANNIVINNIANGNDIGVFLDLNPNNNIISNNKIFDGGTGIYLYIDTYDNNITNNLILDNTYGFLIWSTAYDNLIYNNYVDSKDANIFLFAGQGNFWNITKTAGNNIIGGSYLGGNYWSDYTGDDSDMDGLGDTPYLISPNSQDSHPLVNASVAYEVFKIPLSVGGNFVSIPIIPIQNDTSIEVVLEDLNMNKVNSINYFNHSDTFDHWKSYVPAKIDKGDLWEINRTMGFWINLAENDTLTIAGIVPKETRIQLYEGWNMVGYPSLTSLNVSEALSGIPYERIEGFDPNAPPEYLKLLTDTDLMIPGYGYWIKVSSSATWIVTN